MPRNLMRRSTMSSSFRGAILSGCGIALLMASTHLSPSFGNDSLVLEFVPPSPVVPEKGSNGASSARPQTPAMTPGSNTQSSALTNIQDTFDRPLKSVNATIKPPTGQLPANRAIQNQTTSGTIYLTLEETRPWILSNVEWEAPATRHLPLLFEEPNLERSGITHGVSWEVGCFESGPRSHECLQPLVSGAHFFGRIPFIPYMWGYQSPCEPVYTLGTDRPESPTCYRRHKVPLDLKGAAYQAAAVTGLVFLIP